MARPCTADQARNSAPGRFAQHHRNGPTSAREFDARLQQNAPRVARTVKIKAALEKIYPLINDFHQWEARTSRLGLQI